MSDHSALTDVLAFGLLGQLTLKNTLSKIML
jgi:hypothetical protein